MNAWLRVAVAVLVGGHLLAADGVPVTLRQGFPFVDVQINGHGPFRMLVDTGAGANLLTPQAASRAQIVPDQRLVLATFAGERLVPSASRTPLQVGHVVETGPIVILDLPEVRNLDRHADGVLGQAFLERTAFLLDYQQQRLWLGPEATARADELPRTIHGSRAGGRLVLPVTLEPGGPEWTLTLDSGATNLVVDCGDRCPRTAGLLQPAALVTHVGERAVFRGELRFVSIAGQRFPRADAVLLTEQDTRPDDGVLPARWFSAFYVSGRTVRFR